MLDSYTDPPKTQSWIGAKILLCSVAGLLLSAGLCGAGGGPMANHGGGALTAAGVMVLIASVIGVLVGGLMFIVEVVTAMMRRK